MRVVLDANIILSGVVGVHRPASPPGEIMRRWYADAFQVVVSQPLVDEILRALDEPWFLDRINEPDRSRVIDALHKDADHCLVDDVATPVASHPEDDLILETAMNGRAELLVTGDKQLLALAEHRGIPIVGARAFLALLTSPTINN